MKKTFFLLAILSFNMMLVQAQDNLVKTASATQINKEDKAYRFTNIIDLSTTPVENQGSSGTCWSYSTNSFLESEMIKNGKKPIHLSKIFHARKQYEDKAYIYVRTNGAIQWGDGGEAHDVLEMLTKYGAMPYEAYTGLLNGATRNSFGDMQAAIEPYLKSVINSKSGKVNPVWRQVLSNMLDAYLGKVPETFTFEGKQYTPKSFAKDFVGINPNDYIEFISQTNTPYYEKAPMLASDNWSFQWLYNLPVDDFITLVDNSLKAGHTVAWGADVSEPYFSWPNGVAIVPENALSGEKLKREEIFKEVRKELKITPEIRQQGLDNLTTTDDHGMHIVGLAKDQNGTEYYMVKNSWGVDNDYKGFLYVSKEYVKYKTTTIMVNKKVVPSEIKNKLKVEKDF